MHIFVVLFVALVLVAILGLEIVLGCAVLAAIGALLFVHPLIATAGLIVFLALWLTAKVLFGGMALVAALCRYTKTLLPAAIQQRLYERAILNDYRPNDPEWQAEYRRLKGWDP